MELEEFRRAFQQTTDNGIFFDNASMGPVAPAVTQAMAACMQLRQAMPMKYYQYAQQVFPECRARLARLIGGAAVTPALRRSAEELLDQAEAVKKK